MSTFAELVVDLDRAAEALNSDLAGEITERLVGIVTGTPSEVAFRDAHRAARCLRKKRLFPLLERWVDAYLRSADPNPLLRTVLAQALVDQGRLDDAREVLDGVLRVAKPDEKAAEEARGLVGRIHKDAFVRAGAARGQDELRRAIEAYADAYARAKYDPFWPGINLVALMVRARVEQVKVPEPHDPVALARDLLARASKQLDEEQDAAAAKGDTPRDQPWLVATALEATLALGDDQATVAWGKRYLACQDADAFELGSTHRQLTEIWRLHRRSGSVAATFVPILEGELMRKKPGAFVGGAIGTQTVAVGKELQAVWGAERFQNHIWLRRAVRNADSVARVQDVNGNPIGTGFLLRGEDLSAGWKAKTVFLTNRHVVDGEAPAKGVETGRARVHLTTVPKAPAEGFGVAKEPLWRSGPGAEELDCVVLELVAVDTAPGELDAPPATTIEVGDRASLQPGGERVARIYIVGHPRGAALSYSMYDNALTAIEPPLLYYRSPTLDGSSGSPVFNPDWRLVGIHHSHVPERTANCGTFIDAIRDAIAKR